MCFFVLKDEIVTPALNGSILAGCVRDTVIKILKNERKKIVERKITINELMEHLRSGNLLEAFGTGTAAVISPIGEFGFKGENHFVQKGEIGPISKHLFKTITDIQRGLAEDTYGWMRPVRA